MHLVADEHLDIQEGVQEPVCQRVAEEAETRTGEFVEVVVAGAVAEAEAAVVFVAAAAAVDDIGGQADIDPVLGQEADAHMHQQKEGRSLERSLDDRFENQGKENEHENFRGKYEVGDVVELYLLAAC